jgi:predicted RNase H-like HicB family nuclease
MRYIVIIRRTATGYSVDVPDVPGCIATGMTVEHARQQIAEALDSHLEVLRESEQVIPQATPRLEFTVDEDVGEEFCTWVEVETVATLAGSGE